MAALSIHSLWSRSEMPTNSDFLKVLAAATELTGDAQRAAYLIRNEPLKAFEYKTGEMLIQEGRANDLIRYLESFASGFAG